MLRIVSSTLYHNRPDLKFWAESHREVNAPVSFFEHDGQNLHVIEGFSGDAHDQLRFPNLDIRAAGRVVRNKHKGSANLDPDGMTLDLFSRIVADVYGEYAADMRWEYYNQFYNTQDLLEEFEYTENLRTT